MGSVFAEITLRNSRDVGDALRGICKESEIRQKTVKALVDTGAYMLVINEELRRELGLEIRGKKGVTLANKAKAICELTEAVDIHWKDRSMTMQVAVLPETSYILMGAFPLEGMDLIVDPKREELTGRHGDEPVFFI